jgi:hypothetical protein
MNPLKLFVLIAIAVSLTGCKAFDDLVEELMDTGGLSSKNDYIVTCIDPMVAKINPLVPESALAKMLRKSVNEGITASQQTPKGKNLRLGVPVEGNDKREFYDTVMSSKDITPEKRLDYLRTTCDKIGSNMAIWGVYTGDDKEIKFVCFLYRKDLNAFTVSDVLKYEDGLSEVRQKELISKTVSDLIDRSLPNIGEADSRKISIAVKSAAGDAGKALVTVVLTYLATGSGDTP